jgi:hypothetical protein
LLFFHICFLHPLTINYLKDLDIDDNTSHVEGNSIVIMSAGETESDSENEPIEQEEYPETAYTHTPEEEFGAVSILTHIISS